jgi:hypothetical protein
MLHARTNLRSEPREKRFQRKKGPRREGMLSKMKDIAAEAYSHGPGRASIASAGPRRRRPGDAAAGRRTTRTPARSPAPARGGGPADPGRASIGPAAPARRRPLQGLQPLGVADKNAQCDSSSSRKAAAVGGVGGGGRVSFRR